MRRVKNYIFEKERRRKKNQHHVYGNIPVFIKDELPDNIVLSRVLKKVENTIPRNLLRDLEMVMIGHISEFDERHINALYQDGTVHITNAQVSNEDFVEDLIHELGHCVEEYFQNQLYGDMEVENEFIEKRKKLFYILSDRGYEIPGKYFLDPEYDEDFDMFLYTVVGYPVLLTLTYDLFTSPYAITSIREYFAKGFQEYFLEDEKKLKDISPMLYNKISSLVDKP